MWGHFYFTNRDYGFYVHQMLTDLVTRSYMNCQAQYGVHRGSVDDPPYHIDTNPNDPDPTNLSRQDIQTTLFGWLTNGIVPTPSVDERSRVYIIFLPFGSTFSTADSGLAYHCPGSVPCPPGSSKFNPSSSEDDLFWVAIITNHSVNAGIDTSSPTSFASTTAFVAAHELTEAFTDRDGFGFITTNMPNSNTNGCEIGDICQVIARDPTRPCCDSVDYNVDGRSYYVPYIWSNRDNSCISPFTPISIKNSSKLSIPLLMVLGVYVNLEPMRKVLLLCK
jgi:hypothetical protein